MPEARQFCQVPKAVQSQLMVSLYVSLVPEEGIILFKKWTDSHAALQLLIRNAYRKLEQAC